MGKVGSSSFGVLLVDGYNFLAAKLKGHTHKVTAAQEGSDGLGDTTVQTTPVGISELVMTQSGAFFDDSVFHTLLSVAANLAVTRIVCAAFAGNIIGKSFLGASGVYASAYEVLGQVKALVKANVEYVVTGSIDRGVILLQRAAQTAAYNTKTAALEVDYTLDPTQQNIPIASVATGNPATITTTVPHGLATGQKILISGTTTTPSINGQQTVTVTGALTFTIPVNVTVGAGAGGSFVRANTVNGGVGYLGVSDYSGFTNATIKIRSSADDITYADLVTFTTVTAAPGAQRVTVGGTVDRYLCVDLAVTGGPGSITPFVGFSRF